MNNLMIEKVFEDDSILYMYFPENVCANLMHIRVSQDNVVIEVNIIGGCDGNRKAVAKLVQGLTLEQVIEKIDGITCGKKTTSCADQLAQACKKILKVRVA